MIRETAFKDFARLARLRRWTPEFLAKKFKGKIGSPMEFFHRVVAGKYAEVIIPYRSVLVFYLQELGLEKQNGNGKTCACGCELSVFGRKKWASEGCKKKTARRQVTDHQKVGL